MFPFAAKDKRMKLYPYLLITQLWMSFHFPCNWMQKTWPSFLFLN